MYRIRPIDLLCLVSAFQGISDGYTSTSVRGFGVNEYAGACARLLPPPGLFSPLFLCSLFVTFLRPAAVQPVFFRPYLHFTFQCPDFSEYFAIWMLRKCG